MLRVVIRGHTTTELTQVKASLMRSFVSVCFTTSGAVGGSNLPKRCTIKGLASWHVNCWRFEAKRLGMLVPLRGHGAMPWAVVSLGERFQ